MSESVQVGQVWADNDWRSEGRRIRVIAVDATHATVERVGGSRTTRIRLDRFRPTSTGYALLDPGPDLDEYGPYHGKTWAEIIHDYAVVRGDLSEQYARDQLVALIERRAREANE